MKTKVKYILVIVFLSNFLIMKVFGAIPYPQATPPSSDAAALGKYGQYPVSLCNGLVQIDIPVYTIKMPLFSLPVSISYHASGIKVDDISTPTGLGWVLNAGGVITRTVKGRPDLNIGKPGTIHDKQWVLNNYPSNSDDKIAYLQTIYNNEKNGAADTENDEFFYNFCGFSGSFRYDINGNQIQIPLTNNKIEYDSNTNNFKITGSDGTIYGFTDKETSQCDINSSWVPYTSSWYLSWIITTDNREIDFEYMADNTSYVEQYPNFWMKICRNSPTVTVDWSGLICAVSPLSTTNTLLIKSIMFPGGSIAFNYSGDRIDRRKYRLTGINVKNKNGSLVKAFSLEHSYFTSNQGTGTYKYRLKLDKLGLLDSNNNQIGSYKFDYNTSISLPAYFNYTMYSDPYQTANVYPYFGQDEWGYYNGITTNKTLFIYREEQRPYTMPAEKANRSVNPTYAQACILKKITYPTGGFTEFEYEGNKYATGESAGGLRIKTVKSYSLQTLDTVVHSYQYEEGLGNITGWRRIQGASYTQAEVVQVRPSGTTSCDQELRFFDYYFSMSNLPLSHSGGSSTFYSKVTEFEGSPENSNGKTEYSFLYSLNDAEYVLIDQNPLPNQIAIPRFDYLYINRGWTRGYPTSTKIYKKINGVFTPVKNTAYTYTTFKKQKSIVGFKTFASFGTTNKSICGVVTVNNADDLFQFTDIPAETGLVKLTQVSETSSFDGNAVSQLTNYYYNNLDNQYEVSATYQQNSDNTTVKKAFKYPKDFNLSPYTSMVNRNMLSQVVTTTDSIDSKFLQESETVYSSFSSPFSNPLIVPSSTTIRRGTGLKETEYAFPNYDIYGNPLYITRYGADPVVYIWSYNYQYLIAEIKGVSYSDVTGKIPIATINTIAAKTEPAAADFTTIDGLRNSLTNAQVTTYEYKPLVGMTKMTDPRGVVTKYDYDTFGRLIRVTKADRVIEEYNYHYKN